MLKAEEKITVKKGDRIHIHYRGKLLDGSEFESTYDKEPFEIVLGESKIIKGFQKTLLGMKVNESVSVIYPPEDAYGHYDPALIAVLKKSEFPKNSIPAVGWMMKIGHITVTVQSIDDATVTLDGNHPLAGKNVRFEITVLKIY
jgi:peptidylprolyl isomerase